MSRAMDAETIAQGLDYSIDLPPEVLGKNWLQSGPDYETYTFLVESVRKYNRCFATNYSISILRSMLASFMHHTDILGFLNIGQMHIISARQLQHILQHSYTVLAPIDADQLKARDLASKSTKNRSAHGALKSKGSSPDSQLVSTSIASESSSLLMTASQSRYLSLVMTDIEADLQSSTFATPEVSTANASHKPKALKPSGDRFEGIEDSDDAQSRLFTRGSSIFANRSITGQFGDYTQFTPVPVVQTFGTMLDVGAGNGRMAQLLSPLFTRVECTEVSAQMISQISSKGFIAHRVESLRQLPPDAKYDVICLFNLIDRCDEPLSLLFQLHERLRSQLTQRIDVSDMTTTGATTGTQSDATDTSRGGPNDQSNLSTRLHPGGRVVIATPLPLKPSVEMTLEDNNTFWRTPKENIAPSTCWCCTSFEQSLQHLICSIIDPCGFDVLTVSRLPYLSEGNATKSHFVLQDVILVLTPKPEWIP